MANETLAFATVSEPRDDDRWTTRFLVFTVARRSGRRKMESRTCFKKILSSLACAVKRPHELVVASRYGRKKPKDFPNVKGDLTWERKRSSTVFSRSKSMWTPLYMVLPNVDGDLAVFGKLTPSSCLAGAATIIL